MPFGGLLTLGLIGAGTSLVGGAIGSNAASQASQEQQQSIQQAEGDVTNASNNALTTAGNVYGQQQSELSPYISAGAQGLSSLTSALAPGGSLATPPSLNLGSFSFDPSDLQDTPGYQFQLGQGENAIKNNAAATGTLGGNAAEALDSYSQGLAGTIYNNAYNQALQTYGANTSSQVQNYNAALSGQNSLYQRLTGLAGIGQNATNTDVAAGTGYSNNATSNVLGTGANLAQLATGAGNAQAAGTVGSANAWTNALSGISGSLTNAALYSNNSSYGGNSSGVGSPGQVNQWLNSSWNPGG